ncbi:MAG: hypothetical protein AB1758_29570, partial [Candidatus Eremiobacterota bacterium]
GMTLAEIMVAVAVTAFALLTMIGVFIGGLRLVRQSQSVTVATEGAREVLEAIKDQGYSALPTGDAVFDSRQGDAPVNGFPPAPYPDVAAPDGRKYPTRVAVQDIQPGLKSVTVQVFWDPTRPATVETYFKEPPP